MTIHTVALGPEFDLLPDDTEETLVGTSLHQGAITTLYTSLTLCGPRRGLPWFVGNQIKVVVPRRDNKAPYMPYPDILVHPTITNASRTSLVLAADGPPALVIEVASPATARENDINLLSPAGKPAVYEAIGVGEYLVFDPTGDIIGTQVWARRAGLGGFVPWEPEADGRWVSTSLGIAFEPRGVLLRVYDQDGRLVPITEELADLVDDRDRRLADRDRLLAEQERQLAERDRRLAALEEELRKLHGQ